MKIKPLNKQKDFFDNYKTYCKNINNITKMKIEFSNGFNNIFDINDIDTNSEKENRNNNKRKKIINYVNKWCLNEILNSKEKLEKSTYNVMDLLDELETFISRKEKEFKDIYGADYKKRIVHLPIIKQPITEVIKENIKRVKENFFNTDVIDIKELLGILETRTYLEKLLKDREFHYSVTSVKSGFNLFLEKDKNNKEFYNIFKFRGQMVYGWGLELLTLSKLSEKKNALNIKHISLAPNILVQKLENEKLEVEYYKKQNNIEEDINFSKISFKEEVIFYPTVDFYGKTKDNKNLRIEIKHYFNDQMNVKMLDNMIKRFEHQITFNERYNAETFYSLNFYKEHEVIEIFIDVNNLKNIYQSIKNNIENEILNNKEKYSKNVPIPVFKVSINDSLIDIVLKMKDNNHIFYDENKENHLNLNCHLSSMKINFLNNENLINIFKNNKSKFIDNNTVEESIEVEQKQIETEVGIKVVKKFTKKPAFIKN